jgi:methionyl-tRNA synthetase
MTTTLYVTTTIPYVNAPPHIGFALELVQADAIARYHRLLGATVRLQTGTDENAFKNVLSARARGVPVEELVDENAARFRALCDALDISQDHFVRTTEVAHRRAVHALLGRLKPGDVYRAAYQGLYCAGCEDFYLERDLVDGRLCPEHRTAVVEVAEHNYFFRLSAYAQRVRDLIASQRLRIVPGARETEVLRFIDRGLDDISISRDAGRAGGWGIPYPGDSGQVVYVWIDALVNYLSGLGFPDDACVDRFWGSGARKLHVIGKNVWKFHAVYWPALLLSAGLDVPDEIFAHAFLTIEGKKISKSSGSAPDPVQYVERLGADALRYFLLRYARPFEDTDFSVSRLEAAYDADLANGLGNLCSRLTALAAAAALEGCTGAEVPDPPSGFHDAARAFRFDQALATLWDGVAQINREVSEARPWDHVRAGRVDAARGDLSQWVERLASLAYWLAPFLPSTARAIRGAVSQSPIRKCGPLFPRRAPRVASATTT